MRVETPAHQRVARPIRQFHSKPLWLCGAWVALLVTIQAAEAQQSQSGLEDPIGRAATLVMLAADPAVQDDLGLSDVKRRELSRLAQDLGAAMRNCKCAKDDPESLDRRKALLKQVEDLREAAKKNLSKAELRRIHQIAWQSVGLLGLPEQDDLVKELGLSDKTRKKLRATAEAYDRTLGEFYRSKARGVRGEARTAKLDEMRKEVEAKLWEALSPEEQTKYKAVIGRPFKGSSRGR